MFINSAHIPKLSQSANVSQCKNKYPNLSSLSKDVVSFSGAGKLSPLDMVYAPTEKACRQISLNAEPSRFYLNQILDTYLAPQISSDSNSNDSKPVMHYKTRVKSPVSIREKVVSKYAKNHRKDIKKFTQLALLELSKSFSYTSDVENEDLIKEIADYLEMLHISSKMPPGENISYYFNELLIYTSENKIFDFDEKTSKEQKQIFTTVLDELDLHSDEMKNDLLNPTTIDGIKHYANDIVGARIITNDAGPEYTEVIFNALKKAVSDGVLKITSIESTIPDPDKLPIGKSINDYQYATDEQLNDFAEETGALLLKNKSPSGYLSIHINVDLTDPSLASFGGIFNGYSGEIQILGTDVEHLKDVEDLCYKLKDNKSVVKESYIPFKNHFFKYYNDKTKQAFEDYTYALYLAQREQNASNRKYMSSTFPTLKDLGFDDKLPSELDFNSLEKLKKHCDNMQFRQVNIQNQLRAIQDIKPQKTSHRIDELKNRILYKFSCMIS